jgi:acyl-CoA dehydrogenase
VPIGITVEGANVLTRTLIVFGQGLVRCHPYAHREMEALRAGDARALRRAVLGHAASFLGNFVRAALCSASRGRLAPSRVRGPAARWVRRLSWASAVFALLTDLALLAHGGRLKLREKLGGRFADALSWMYFGAAALRRFEAEGRRAEDRPLLDWALGECLARTQTAFEGILGNFGTPILGRLLAGPVAWWARLDRLAAPPSDRLGARAAAVLLAPGEARERLTAGIFAPADPGEARGRLEEAFRLTHESLPLEERLGAAVREGKLPRGSLDETAARALDAALLSPGEADLLRRAAAARRRAIEVDSFTLEEYLGTARQPAPAAAGIGELAS